jgi:hypothetical protein
MDLDNPELTVANGPKQSRACVSVDPLDKATCVCNRETRTLALALYCCRGLRSVCVWH